MFVKCTNQNPGSLGLSREHALAAAKKSDDTEGLLAALGVDEGLVELNRSLHDGSWFRFRDSAKVLLACRGGRQGCKLGAVVFNLIYAKALRTLRGRLREAGVCWLSTFAPRYLSGQSTV